MRIFTQWHFFNVQGSQREYFNSNQIRLPFFKTQTIQFHCIDTRLNALCIYGEGTSHEYGSERRMNTEFKLELRDRICPIMRQERTWNAHDYAPNTRD